MARVEADIRSQTQPDDESADACRAALEAPGDPRGPEIPNRSERLDQDEAADDAERSRGGGNDQGETPATSSEEERSKDETPA